MIVRSPAWIIAVGALLVQASGALSLTGNALIGIDHAITATIDLKKIVASILPPPKPVIPKIKPVVVPPRKMPTKTK